MIIHFTNALGEALTEDTLPAIITTAANTREGRA